MYKLKAQLNSLYVDIFPNDITDDKKNITFNLTH